MTSRTSGWRRPRSARMCARGARPHTQPRRGCSTRVRELDGPAAAAATVAAACRPCTADWRSLLRSCCSGWRGCLRSSRVRRARTTARSLATTGAPPPPPPPDPAGRSLLRFAAAERKLACAGCARTLRLPCACAATIDGGRKRTRRMFFFLCCPRKVARATLSLFKIRRC